MGPFAPAPDYTDFAVPLHPKLYVKPGWFCQIPFAPLSSNQLRLAPAVAVFACNGLGGLTWQPLLISLMNLTIQRPVVMRGKSVGSGGTIAQERR